MFKNTWNATIGEIELSGENKVMISSSKLLACALARKVNNPAISGTVRQKSNHFFKGINYLGVGSGDAGWTNDDFVSGTDVTDTLLDNEVMRNVFNKCYFIENVSSIPYSGTSNQLLDYELLKYKPSELYQKVLAITSGINSGTSSLIYYDPETQILTNDEPVNKIYLEQSLGSGYYNVPYEIYDVKSSGIRVTDRLYLESTMTASAAFTFREFGLFGANATSGLNTGILFNKVLLSGTQPTWAKDQTATINMIIRIQR